MKKEVHDPKVKSDCDLEFFASNNDKERKFIII